MSFLETKGALAKLLATENLTVQHDSTARTASFNTSTRVLTLPLLQVESSHVYDMFVGHEVGHALWTPQDWAEHVPEGVPHDFINVIEDVRIERSIQDKFPGLRVDFARGYDYLNQKDFFEIADADFTKMNLVDRINLHFKLGDRALIPFSESERVYVNAVSEADTFDKVCLVAKMLADHLNASANDNQQLTPQVSDTQDGQSDDTSVESREVQQDADSDPEGDSDSDEIGNDTDTVDAPSAGMDKSETQRALDRNLERLTKQDDGRNRVVYLRSQLTDIAQAVTPIEFLREDLETRIAEFDNTRLMGVHRVREDFAKFMSSIKRDVNFMVQQFEMRKSADAYARQQIHRTGVLDTERLHAYKLTDDIFLRQTITPDGKNHGMMMLLDWSGSMQNIALATVKQVIVLAQFCRKVNIPFDVYTFTCQGYGYPFNTENPDDNDDDFENRIAHHGPLLVNVLSSSVKRRHMEQDMFHLFMSAAAISGSYYTLPVSTYLHMGGTPLNNTLFMLPELIRRLKQRSNAQKISCVVVTDGESSPLYYYSRSIYGSLHHNMINPYDTVLLRDGNHTYQIDATTGTTNSIVDVLRKKMPDVSISHIFLGGPKPCHSYARYVTDRTQEIDSNEFRKHGACVVKPTTGWPLVALINPNIFGDAQDEMQCDAGASKAQIRQALRKMLKSKSSAKVVLSQLVESFS